MTEPIAVEVPAKPAFARSVPGPLPASASVPSPAPIPVPAPRVEAPLKPEAPKPAPAPVAKAPTDTLAAPAPVPALPNTMSGLLANLTKKQLKIGAAAVLSLVAGIGLVRLMFPGKEDPKTTTANKAADQPVLSRNTPAAPTAAPSTPATKAPSIEVSTASAEVPSVAIPTAPLAPLPPSTPVLKPTGISPLPPVPPVVYPDKPVYPSTPVYGDPPKPPPRIEYPTAIPTAPGVVPAAGTEAPKPPPGPGVPPPSGLIPPPPLPAAPPAPGMGLPGGVGIPAAPAMPPGGVGVNVGPPGTPPAAPGVMAPVLPPPADLAPPVVTPITPTPPKPEGSGLPPIPGPTPPGGVAIPPSPAPGMGGLPPVPPGPATPVPPPSMPGISPTPPVMPDVKPTPPATFPPVVDVTPKPEFKPPTPDFPPPPGMGTPAVYTKPGGTTDVKPNFPEPKTDFDVDLHDAKLNDSYESISQEFYNDRKYAAALKAFNRNQPLTGGRLVEVPPIHVLKKKFPTLVGGVPTAGSSGGPPSSAPQWGPSGDKTDPVPGRATGTYRNTYVIPSGSGMSMKGVAKVVYGNEQRWSDIYNLNGGYKSDELLPPGTELKLP